MPDNGQIPGIYDPEGLYSVASDAGFVPPVDFGARGTSTSTDVGSPLTSPTSENAYPGVMPGDLIPPSLPSLPSLPQEPAVRGEGTKTETSRGSSVSARFTPPGKISARDRELESANQRGEARIAAESTGVLSAQDEARQAGEGAVSAQTQAVMDKITQQGRDAVVLKQLHDGFMEQELTFNAQATAAENQAKTDYLSALNDYRAQRVDPSQLFGSMSGGQRFGMLVSAFAHDFLGAKGIKTSAMDTLNRAIDRNIDSQLTALKQKGEVAQGFKNLWEMQRAQSASDAEARARVRGFMLESAKQQLVATLAPYESALASANGKAALAKIDEEYAKNMIQVYSHISANTNAMRNQNIQWAGDKLRADMQAYSTSVQAKDLAFRQKQYDDQQKAMGQIPEADIVIDPESNRGKWVFKYGIGEKEKADTRDRMEAVQEVNKQLSDLRQLNREVGPVFDAIKGTRFAEEAHRRYNAMTLALAHARAKANGERATDKDVDQFRESFPIDTVLTRGGVDTIMAWAQTNAIAPAYNRLQQVSKDLPESMWTTGPVQKPFAASAADAEATVKASTPKAKAAKEADPTDYAVQYMNAPDANDRANKSDYAKSGIDPQAMKLGWSEWQDKYAPPPSKGGDYGKAQVFAGKDEPPAWAVSLESLKNQALKGDPKAMDALAKEATDYRQRDAKYDSDSDRDIRQAFALYQLNIVAHTPHPTSPAQSEPEKGPEPKSPGPITDRPQSGKYIPRYRR